MSVIIKPVKLAETEDIYPARIEHYGHFFKEGEMAFFEFEDRLKAKEKYLNVLGAYENEKLAGRAIYEKKFGICTIKEIVIKKEDRGKGIGKILLDEVLKEDSHKFMIKLVSTEKNNMNFYLKNDFKIEAELKKYWGGYDFYLLSRQRV